MFRQHVYRSSVVVAIALITAAAVVTSSDLGAQRQRFFSDDPLLRDPETQDASKVEAWEIGLTPDLLLNLFSKPGDRASNVRAQNVNTADEVPDSGWFTNRVYATPLTTDDVTRGPLTSDGPAPGKWIVVGGKGAGVAPGFTARDEKGVVWFVSFDGRDNPVAPTAAIAVATRLFWALGYFQVENHLTTLRPENVVVDSSATMRAHGKRRQMTKKDIDQVFDRAARSADGSYRAIAGRALPGRPVGGFKYHGTRPDDPNDVVPHEHRRELRALQVFGAWANLVDMKAGNTLDTVITENGRGVVRHYLQDVGSTFGTGALAARDGDEGYEYLYEGEMLSKRLLTLGFFLSPWQTVDYDEHPEIGRFEGDEFEPEDWKPRVPVAALRHDPSGRRALGGAAGDGIHGRPDPGRREDRQLHGSGGGEAARRHPDQAAQQDRPRVLLAHQSARPLRAHRHRAGLREPRGQGRSQRGSQAGLPRDVVSLQQRHRRSGPDRVADHHQPGTAAGASRSAA